MSQRTNFFKHILAGILTITAFITQANSSFIVLYAWNNIDNEYQVIMGHKKQTNTWSLLGGLIQNQLKESFEQAACRQVYEKSGRWYGSNLIKNLSGQCSFSPDELSKKTKIVFEYNKSNHILFFKEISYVDPQIIVDSLSDEKENLYKLNDNFGWMPLKTFAYHCFKIYSNEEHFKRLDNFDTLPWAAFTNAKSLETIKSLINKELELDLSQKEIKKYLNEYYTENPHRSIKSAIQLSDKNKISRLSYNCDDYDALTYWKQTYYQPDLEDPEIDEVIYIEKSGYYFTKCRTHIRDISFLLRKRQELRITNLYKKIDWCILSDALDEQKSFESNDIITFKGPIPSNALVSSLAANSSTILTYWRKITLDEIVDKNRYKNILLKSPAIEKILDVNRPNIRYVKYFSPVEDLPSSSIDYSEEDQEIQNLLKNHIQPYITNSNSS